MDRMMGKILHRYGRQIRIQGKDKPVFAFLQPVTSQGENSARMGITPLGVEQTRQYVYIGPAEPGLAVEDILLMEDREYLVRRAEQIHGIDGPLYQWAMCEAKGEVDLWDTNG